MRALRPTKGIHWFAICWIVSFYAATAECAPGGGMGSRAAPGMSGRTVGMGEGPKAETRRDVYNSLDEALRAGADVMRNIRALRQMGSWRTANEQQAEVERILTSSKEADVVDDGYKESGARKGAVLKFKSGLSVMFKWGGNEVGSHWRHEIAAYRLDKLFRIHLTPVTVPFRYKGNVGSIQLMTEGALIHRFIAGQDERKAESLFDPQVFQAEVAKLESKYLEFKSEITKLELLDYLTENRDRGLIRNQGTNNVFVGPGGYVFAIDNGDTFGSTTLVTPDSRKPGPAVPGREVYEHMASISDEAIQTVLRNLVTSVGIDLVLKRRRVALQAMKQRYGEIETPASEESSSLRPVEEPAGQKPTVESVGQKVTEAIQSKLPTKKLPSLPKKLF